MSPSDVTDRAPDASDSLRPAGAGGRVSSAADARSAPPIQGEAGDAVVEEEDEEDAVVDSVVDSSSLSLSFLSLSSLSSLSFSSPGHVGYASPSTSSAGTYMSQH